MKRLYLIRHAQPGWPNPDQDDFDRRLTARGQRDAQFMGKKLARSAMAADYFMTSPARRAVATARLIANEIGYGLNEIVQEKQLYLANLKTLLTLIKRSDATKNVLLVVGHNPGLTELANHLCKRRIDAIPPCGICCVEINGMSWREISDGAGDFVFLDYPWDGSFT